MGPIYQYAATLVRVIDGDTYVCDVDAGFHWWKHDTRIRVRNFDTAELRSSNPLEVIHAKEARDFMISQLPVGHQIVLVTAQTAVYDRWQADVWFQRNGIWYSAADVLAAGGFAKRSEY